MTAGRSGLVGLAAALLLTTMGLAAPAAAGSVTKVYDFHLDAPNGYDITHLALFATDGTRDDLHLPTVVLPPAGRYQLSHTMPFDPTAALIIGITERDKDDSWDILFFTTSAYVAEALGVRFDAMFPPADNPRHPEVGPMLQQAHAGDPAAVTALTDFLRGPDAARAYFDPEGPFTIMQFTVGGPGFGGSVPLPGPLPLGLTGLSLLFAVNWLRRRRP